MYLWFSGLSLVTVSPKSAHLPMILPFARLAVTQVLVSTAQHPQRGNSNFSSNLATHLWHSLSACRAGELTGSTFSRLRLRGLFCRRGLALIVAHIPIRGRRGAHVSVSPRHLASVFLSTTGISAILGYVAIAKNHRYAA
jgi:hypothetical protein